MDKQSKLDYFKLQRIVDELKPIEYNGIDYDFTANSQRRLQIAFNAILGTDEKVIWTNTANEEIELDANDIKAIFAAAMVRCNELHNKYKDLKAAVNAAETEEELALIVW